MCIGLAVLACAAAGIAVALNNPGVVYDKYAPVTVVQNLSEEARADSWFTIQFKESGSADGVAYRQAIIDPSSCFMATAALDSATLTKLYDGTATVSEAATVNYRSASDIAADMAVLHGTADANNQDEDKTAVTSRWKGIRGGDSPRRVSG